MKANELRVGNYYTTGIEVKGSREAKLNLMDDRMVQLTLDHLLVLSGIPEWLFAIHPIPLTEEWLKKFGLKNEITLDEDQEEHAVWRLGNFILIDEWNSGHYTPHEDSTYRIEYVHQLQNLYFALTGKEFISL